MIARRLAVLVAVLVGTSACVKGTMPNPTSDLAGLTALPQAQVGVVEVDITPPPGLGLFGHGPESRVAEGTQLRLRCHAFVFVGPRAPDGSAEALAFVPCELPAPSLLLQRRVAEIVRAHTPLGAERVWISATHTHAGPGHYFAAQNYTGPLSGRRIGYDHNVLEFLATRIAAAIGKAYETRKVGRWRWGTSRVQGLGKNRSYAILLRNHHLPSPLAEQLPEPGFDPALNAVDQQLSVLRVEQQAADETWQPLAALMVFGLHPTVIDHRNSLYTGDAFGYATRALATQLEARHQRPVLVAMANGIEGDVTAVRNGATPAEARRVGAEIARQALPVWDQIGADPALQLDAAPTLRSAYRELDLPGARTAEGDLCPTPEVGTPVGGGADDHPTFWRALDSFQPGARRRQQTQDCQNPKFFIQGLSPSTPGETFPGMAPVAVAQLGNGLLVTLPAELTTVVGMRIRADVLREAARHAGAPSIVAVVGLSHEYLQYVASAEEYPAQHYEGASTLYGPHTGELLRAQATCLTAYLWGAQHTDCRWQRQPINTVRKLPYNAGFFHASWWSQVPERAEGAFELGAPHNTETGDGALALESELRGLAPSDVRDPGSFGIQVLEGSKLLDHEQGSNLSVRWDDDRHVWTVTWTPDVTANPALCGSSVRFRVRAKQRAIESPPAQLVCSACLARTTP